MFSKRQSSRKKIYNHLKGSVHGSLSLEKISTDLNLCKKLVCANLKTLEETNLVTQYKFGRKTIYKAL